MKYYYAVEFFDQIGNTMGSPNALTGLYSRACNVMAFHCKKHRDEYVNEYSQRIRKPVSLSGLRPLCLGLSMPMFKHWLDDLQSRAD
jgi:hypothetical protein